MINEVFLVFINNFELRFKHIQFVLMYGRYSSFAVQIALFDTNQSLFRVALSTFDTRLAVFGLPRWC